MDELALICGCGHRMKVSAFAIGSKGRCRKCGEVLVVSEDNTRPIAAPSTRIPEPQAGERETCARCGKPFKGDWDRTETALGILCHHCSVLATEGPPQALTARREPATDEPEGWVPEVETAKPDPKPRWKVDTQSKGFRRILWAAAIGTVGLTLVFAVIDPGSGGSSGTGQEPAATAEAAPAWVEGVLRGWEIFSGIAGAMFGFYMTFRLRKGLPNDVLWKDLLFVGWIVAVFGAVDLGAWAVAWVLQSAPAAAMGGGFVVGLLALVIQVLLLLFWLDFGFIDILFLVVFFFLGSLFLASFGILLGGALAAIAL